MMTDMEKTVIFLDGLGVSYHVDRNPKILNDSGEWQKCMTITLRQGDKRVGGYSDFIVIFEFNTDGSLIQVGAWE